MSGDRVDVVQYFVEIICNEWSLFFRLFDPNYSGLHLETIFSTYTGLHRMKLIMFCNLHHMELIISKSTYFHQLAICLLFSQLVICLFSNLQSAYFPNLQSAYFTNMQPDLVIIF